MANIKNMAMANTIFANENIEVKKACLGLSTKITYLPTGSRVKGYQNEYAVDQAPKLREIIGAANGSVAAVAAKVGKVAVAANGPIRLDIAASDDREFVAIQMSRFEDFAYNPTSDVRLLTGDDAKAAAEVLI